MSSKKLSCNDPALSQSAPVSAQQPAFSQKAIETSTNNLSVFIVEDEEQDRILMEAMLGRLSGFRWVGSCASADEALVAIPSAKPHLVLMDIRMPGMAGTECARRLKSVLPGLIIIIVSGLDHPDNFAQALEAGADDYLAKPVSAVQFFATLTFCLRRMNGAVKERQHRKRGGWRALTGRENQVMSLFAKGYLYKEESTVHKHQHNAFRKLGAGNRTEALNGWRDSDHI